VDVAASFQLTCTGSEQGRSNGSSVQLSLTRSDGTAVFPSQQTGEVIVDSEAGVLTPGVYTLRYDSLRGVQNGSGEGQGSLAFGLG
jgi:hypothetical protein